MQENAAFTHQAEDAKSLQKVYDHIKQKSNPIVTLKTNLYMDRFIRLTSSETPVACQRDLSESNFNILTFGVRVPKPRKFNLPSSYLAHTIFPEDAYGKQWINNFKRQPATDSFSPIEVFPFTNALGVANIKHVRTFASPDFPSYHDSEDVQNQPSTSKSASSGLKQKQLKTAKRKVKKDDAGISHKSKSVRPNPPPPIANISPVDCVSLPDIILNI